MEDVKRQLNAMIEADKPKGKREPRPEPRIKSEPKPGRVDHEAVDAKLSLAARRRKRAERNRTLWVDFWRANAESHRMAAYRAEAEAAKYEGMTIDSQR